MKPIILILSFGLLALATPNVYTTADLKACIQNASWGSTCELSSGIFDIDYTNDSAGLRITRGGSSGNPLRIIGAGVGTTIIRRLASDATKLPWLFFANSGADHLFFQNLTIDGNRYAVQTLDPAYCGLQNPGYYDIAVQYADDVLIDNVQMINGPGAAITGGSHTVVQYSQVGVMADPTKANRGTGIFLTGTQSQANSNLIYWTGTSGITLGFLGVTSDHQTVLSNYLYNDRYEMPDNSPGGAISLWYGASDAIVGSNIIDLNHWIQPSSGTINGCPVTVGTAGSPVGIDQDTGARNQYLNNDISHSNWQGMVFFRTEDTLISGYPYNGTDPPFYIWDNTSAGIWFNATAFSTPNIRPRLDHPRLLSNGSSGFGAGVLFDSDQGGSSYGFVSDSCMNYNGTNVVVWNSLYPTYTTTVNTTPTTFASCP